MAVVNPYANKAYKPKGNAFWDARLNEGLFGQTYRGPGQVTQGGGPGGGRGGPDYAGLINNMLNQGRADSRAESVADEAGRNALIRRVAISLGEAPDTGGISPESSGILGSVLDDRTRQLIEQNTAEGTSMLARLNQANEQTVRQIPASYAGKGMLRSGSTGHALAQQAMQHKQKGFDVRQDAAGQIESAVGSFAANERARLRAEAEAERQAAWQLAGLWEDTDFGPEEPAGQGPTDPHPMDDPYWQNLINYYEGAQGRGPTASPKKKYQRMGPYGPYGPAVMPRSGMR